MSLHTWLLYLVAAIGLSVTPGPNSLLASAHTTLGEQQVHYLLEMLQTMVDEDIQTYEVSAEDTSFQRCMIRNARFDGAVVFDVK